MSDKTDSPQYKQPKRVSSAPPPITPLRGSGRVATIQRPPSCPPEWSQWAMMDRVETWEAAALSINLEPRRIDRNKNLSFPDDETYELFVMRARAVDVAPWRALGRNQLGVCLPDFAAWAVSKDLDIPAKLASMARPIKAPEVTTAESVSIQPAATSVAPESDEATAFHPSIGWQVALYDAWSAMKILHGREPSAAEAIWYLKKSDTSGTILSRGGDNELWWRTNRGKAKEVQFRTVETCISSWRTSGRLPA